VAALPIAPSPSTMTSNVIAFSPSVFVRAVHPADSMCLRAILHGSVEATLRGSPPAIRTSLFRNSLDSATLVPHRETPVRSVIYDGFLQAWNQHGWRDLSGRLYCWSSGLPHGGT